MEIALLMGTHVWLCYWKPFLWPNCFPTQIRMRESASWGYRIHIGQLPTLNDIGSWNLNLIHKPLILSPPLQPAGSAGKVTSYWQTANIESQAEIAGWIFSICVWLPGWEGMAGQFTSPSGLNGHSPYSTDEYFIRSDSIKSAELDDMGKCTAFRANHIKVVIFSTWFFII